MKEWVIFFCIVATVFAVFAIVYVIASVIRECKKYGEKRRKTKRIASASSGSLAMSDRYVLPAMLCGTVCAVSGLLIWSALSKEKTAGGSRACISARKRRKKNCGVRRLICR